MPLFRRNRELSPNAPVRYFQLYEQYKDMWHIMPYSELVYKVEQTLSDCEEVWIPYFNRHSENGWFDTSDYDRLAILFSKDFYKFIRRKYGV